MSNQPLPLTCFQHLDCVSEEVHSPQTAKALDDAESTTMALDELRKKLCAAPPLPQKPKWHFW
jgi:hypothetical protein